ncbi:hypothetical protein HGM15179_003549 [Zosterops borbonicus]|uniref:Uncharacterized protein n=1 Tax=Zosterops borbonicus TaxID=364589 RepID=A0A8K1GQR6_9PASS|nr:hypothetical protein HGM15179_003549 [Zosterops borbonicus]
MRGPLGKGKSPAVTPAKLDWDSGVFTLFQVLVHFHIGLTCPMTASDICSFSDNPSTPQHSSRYGPSIILMQRLLYTLLEKKQDYCVLTHDVKSFTVSSWVIHVAPPKEETYQAVRAGQISRDVSAGSVENPALTAVTLQLLGISTYDVRAQLLNEKSTDSQVKGYRSFARLNWYIYNHRNRSFLPPPLSSIPHLVKMFNQESDPITRQRKRRNKGGECKD